jgi:hypothetical protein
MCTQSSLLPKNLDVLTNELIKVNIPINNIIITPGDHILIALGLQFEPAVVDALLPILYYQVKLNIAVIPFDAFLITPSGGAGGICDVAGAFAVAFAVAFACVAVAFACVAVASLIKSDVF